MQRQGAASAVHLLEQMTYFCERDGVSFHTYNVFIVAVSYCFDWSDAVPVMMEVNVMDFWFLINLILHVLRILVRALFPSCVCIACQGVDFNMHHSCHAWPLDVVPIITYKKAAAPS